MPALWRKSGTARDRARHPIQGRRMVRDRLREEIEWGRFGESRRRSNRGRWQGILEGKEIHKEKVSHANSPRKGEDPEWPTQRKERAPRDARCAKPCCRLPVSAHDSCPRPK